MRRRAGSATRIELRRSSRPWSGVDPGLLAGPFLPGPAPSSVRTSARRVPLRALRPLPPAIGPLESDHPLPLDVVLQYDPVDLLVGGLSSSLLIGPMIGGRSIRAATFANEVGPLLGWPWQRVGDLILSAVPTVECVLSAHAPASRPPNGAARSRRRPPRCAEHR
jgi:hypothetical protein